MKPILLVAYDLETTGVDVGTANIVQIAAVTATMKDGRAKAHTLFSSLVNPGKPIPEGASEVHHIYDKDVVWEPGQKRALATFQLLLQTLSVENTVVLCGHNIVRYDDPIIDRISEGKFMQYDRIDTYTAAARMFPTKEQKLGPLFEWYCGQQAVDAHAAAADCHMVMHILAKMLQERGGSVTDFIEWLIDPVIWEVMPYGKYQGKAIKDVPPAYFHWMRMNFTEISGDLEATICSVLGSCNS